MIAQQYKWLYGDFYTDLQILFGRLICGFHIFIHGFLVTNCHNIAIYIIPCIMHVVFNLLVLVVGWDLSKLSKIIFFDFINLILAKKCLVKCMGKAPNHIERKEMQTCVCATVLTLLKNVSSGAASYLKKLNVTNEDVNPNEMTCSESNQSVIEHPSFSCYW